MAAKDMFPNTDILIIMAINFTRTSDYANLEVALNMVAVENFKWTLQRLCIVTLLAVGASLVVLKLVQRLNMTIDIYFTCVVYLLVNCTKTLVFNVGSICKMELLRRFLFEALYS